MQREIVYLKIDGERDYQDGRWGGTIHTPAEWLLYMRHYIDKASDIATTEPDHIAHEKIMAAIRKITAMGVCAMEQQGCPSRKV